MHPAFTRRRWLSQLRGTGWDVHLFDPTNRLVHDELEDITLYTGWKKPRVPTNTRIRAHWPFLRGRSFVANRLPWLWRKILPAPELRLAESSSGSHPTVSTPWRCRTTARPSSVPAGCSGDTCPLPGSTPCRGSDIYFYRQFPEHVPQIRNVLEACDFLMCNCRRDRDLAREYGFRGQFLGFFQGGGGYPIGEMVQLRRPEPVAERRVIAVKGSQNQIGQSLVCIEALRLCAAELRPFTLKFYHLNNQPTRTAAEELARETGITVELVPRSPHRKIWSIFGEARLAIAVSRSDGIPNSMVEAMIMGAFPDSDQSRRRDCRVDRRRNQRLVGAGRRSRSHRHGRQGGAAGR